MSDVGATFADLVLLGGRIITLPDGAGTATSLAIVGDRIVAVGDEEAASAYVGPYTQVEMLEGRAVIPAFIDAHAHVVNLGVARSAIDCKAPRMQSIDAIVDAVRERTLTSPPGTWIRGRGYDQRRLAEGRHPTRYDLDPVSPDHPVLLTRTCGHIVAFNSRAMALAGLEDQSSDPVGGWFDRRDGKITGIGFEMAQLPLQTAAPLTDDEIESAVEAAQQAYLAAGCASIQDAGGLLGTRAFGLIQRLHDAGRLHVRVTAFATLGSEDIDATAILSTGIRTGFGDDYLRVGAFKVVTDGSSSGPTAATSDPYDSDPSSRGLLYRSDRSLKTLLRRAHRSGMQITTHAVGDRAVAQTLSAFEHIVVAHDRPRIEHCAMVLPAQRPRLASLGVIPVIQPHFVHEFGDGYLADYGPERGGRMFGARSLLSAGLRVAGSSDAPVSDHRPLAGIEAAMTRRTASGAVCGEEERVGFVEALRMYTTDAAYATFEEDRKGRIEPGLLADLTVLDGDPSTRPPDGLRDMPVIMTIVNGEVAYRAG